MKKIFLMAGLLMASMIGMSQVQVSQKKSRTEVLNDKYASGIFKTTEGTIFDIENENVQAYFNILDWLEGRVAGLQVFVSRSGTRIPVIRGSLATIFVDEMRMDASFLNSLSTNDVAMIKIIKGPFAGGVGNSGGGAIAIYTIKGEDEEDED